MEKINNNSLLSGYIKQLLNSFNLPKAKVVDDTSALYGNAFYIKNNKLYSSYLDSSGFTRLKELSSYIFNQKYLNITKNLELTNSLYDSYTHKYLGDYLRFLRDYKKLDLMSMYNCYAGDIAKQLKIDVTKEVDSEIRIIHSFDSSDSRCALHLVPVKFNKNYTIAIDSTFPIEIMACFYVNDRESFIKNSTVTDWDKRLNNFYRYTYKKIGGSRYSKPQLYTCLNDVLSKFDVDTRASFYSQESNLMLIIKVPLQNKSSLTVLEGDYTKTSEYTFNVYGKSGSNNIPTTLDNQKSWFFMNASGEYEMILSADETYYTNTSGTINTEPFKIGQTYYFYEDSVLTSVTLDTDTVFYSFEDSYQTVNFNVCNYDRKDVSKEEIEEEGTYKRTYNSKVQLLYVNDGTSYLFADALIAYLLDLCITNTDSIEDNIRRLQKYFITAKDDNGNKLYSIYKPRVLGKYSDELRDIVYDYQRVNNILNNNFDINGYVDKVTEKTMGSVVNYDVNKLHNIQGGVK